MTFRLPPYPYDRLDGLAKLAAALPGGMVDCSIGTPYDPPLPAVIEALAASGTERGYPASAGSPQLREAAAAWLVRRFGLDEVPLSTVAACVGTKEFVASAPTPAAPARAGEGHGAVSGGVLSELCHGCRAGRLPGGRRPGPTRPLRRARPRRDRRRGRVPEPSCSGRTRRRTRRAASATSARRPRGAGRTGCRCSPTSATPSSRGTVRLARCSSTAPTAWWPCIRCPSAPTSLVSGLGSTRGTPSWWSSCARCASTRD